MDRLGQQLFSRAAFATNQHAGLAGGHLADHVEYRTESGAAANDRFATKFRRGCRGQINTICGQFGLQDRDLLTLLGQLIHFRAQLFIEVLQVLVDIRTVQGNPGDLAECREKRQILGRIHQPVLFAPQHDDACDLTVGLETMNQVGANQPQQALCGSQIVARPGGDSLQRRINQ